MWTSSDERSRLLHRLRSAQGHLSAVISMVEDQASCDEVIHQLFAVQGALGAVCRHMVEGDIHRCLEVLRLGESPDEMNLALEKILHLAQIIRAKVRTPERVQI